MSEWMRWAGRAGRGDGMDVSAPSAGKACLPGVRSHVDGCRELVGAEEEGVRGVDAFLLHMPAGDVFAEQFTALEAV